MRGGNTIDCEQSVEQLELRKDDCLTGNWDYVDRQWDRTFLTSKHIKG